MNEYAKLIRALRCYANVEAQCIEDKCPYYSGICDIDAILVSAADALEKERQERLETEK